MDPNELIIPTIDAGLPEAYKKPLPNNPNHTYGTAFSPDQIKLYTIGKSPELQSALINSR